jgi:hypothetical protein
MKNLILIICVLLSACGTFSKKPEPLPVIPGSTVPVRIDSYLLQECEPAMEAPDQDSFAVVAVENLKIFAACRKKQSDSIKVIKELANIEVKQK